MCNTCDSIERAGGIEKQYPAASRDGDTRYTPVKTCRGPEIRDYGSNTSCRGTDSGNESKSRVVKDVKKRARCSNCSIRTRYEVNPRSLIGRIWRWHTSFCPGWKSYMRGLSDKERAEVIAKYNLK